MDGSQSEIYNNGFESPVLSYRDHVVNMDMFHCVFSEIQFQMIGHNCDGEEKIKLKEKMLQVGLNKK